MWPASLIRAASVSPDVSLDSSRVSETVRTAMRTGTKGTLSSIGSCCIAHHHVLHGRSGRRIGPIFRPIALGRLVERRRIFAGSTSIHPIIGKHTLDVVARLAGRHALDEEE